MKPEKIGMSMEDAQFIERNKLGITDICRIFRVPPHKIMDLERATFSNIEQQSIAYVVDAIRPWAVRWEQSINNKLLTEGYFAEHLIDALMRGDIISRYQAYAIGRRIKMLSANECRAFENMNPYEGGDVYENPDIDTTDLNIDPNKSPSDPVSEEEKEEAARAIKKLRLIRGK
jgi:HK97 family phage portal protein